MPRRTKVSIRPIDHYEVRDAVNTVARAREHLGNPKMVKAMQAHVKAMNAAVTGPLKPKALRGKK